MLAFGLSVVDYVKDFQQKHGYGDQINQKPQESEASPDQKTKRSEDCWKKADGDAVQNGEVVLDLVDWIVLAEQQKFHHSHALGVLCQVF